MQICWNEIFFHLEFNLRLVMFLGLLLFNFLWFQPRDFELAISAYPYVPEMVHLAVIFLSQSILLYYLVSFFLQRSMHELLNPPQTIETADPFSILETGRKYKDLLVFHTWMLTNWSQEHSSISKSIKSSIWSVYRLDGWWLEVWWILFLWSDIMCMPVWAFWLLDCGTTWSTTCHCGNVYFWWELQVWWLLSSCDGRCIIFLSWRFSFLLQFSWWISGLEHDWDRHETHKSLLE